MGGQVFKIMFIFVNSPSTDPTLLRDRKNIMGLTPIGQTNMARFAAR